MHLPGPNALSQGIPTYNKYMHACSYLLNPATWWVTSYFELTHSRNCHAIIVPKRNCGEIYEACLHANRYIQETSKHTRLSIVVAVMIIDHAMKLLIVLPFTMLPVVDQWSTTGLYSGESEIRKVHILDTSLLVQSLCIKIREAISSLVRRARSKGHRASEREKRQKEVQLKRSRPWGRFLRSSACPTATIYLGRNLPTIIWALYK